jgi:hypothetical protein
MMQRSTLAVVTVNGDFTSSRKPNKFATLVGIISILTIIAIIVTLCVILLGRQQQSDGDSTSSFAYTNEVSVQVTSAYSFHPNQIMLQWAAKAENDTVVLANWIMRVQLREPRNVSFVQREFCIDNGTTGEIDGLNISTNYTIEITEIVNLKERKRANTTNQRVLFVKTAGITPIVAANLTVIHVTQILNVDGNITSANPDGTAVTISLSSSAFQNGTVLLTNYLDAPVTAIFKSDAFDCQFCLSYALPCYCYIVDAANLWDIFETINLSGVILTQATPEDEITEDDEKGRRRLISADREYFKRSEFEFGAGKYTAETSVKASCSFELDIEHFIVQKMSFKTSFTTSKRETVDLAPNPATEVISRFILPPIPIGPPIQIPVLGLSLAFDAIFTLSLCAHIDISTDGIRILITKYTAYETFYEIEYLDGEVSQNGGTDHQKSYNIDAFTAGTAELEFLLSTELRLTFRFRFGFDDGKQKSCDDYRIPRSLLNAGVAFDVGLSMSFVAAMPPPQIEAEFPFRYLKSADVSFEGKVLGTFGVDSHQFNHELGTAFKLPLLKLPEEVLEIDDGNC